MIAAVIRLASVNVNGIRAAYRKGMADWLDGLPHGLSTLLRAMTESDPAGRPDAARLARALGPARPASRSGRWRRRLVAMALLVLTVGAGGTAGSIGTGPRHAAAVSARTGR